MTKGRGNSKHDKAKSNCPNYPVKNFSLRIALKKKYLKIFPLYEPPSLDANKCFWSYKMGTHYKAEHTHLPIP